MDISAFGTLIDADAVGRRDVEQVTLQSSALTVSLLTYGATLHAVEAPDRDGVVAAVCLGLPTADDHHDHERNPFIGATCGRWANRIAGSSYEIDGERYELPANDGDAHLHGGPEGFSRRVWDIASATQDGDGGTVVLALRSEAGDQGHPGAVDVTATFALHGHVLRITYEATTDAPTAFGLTNHAYWNLAGPSAWEIEGSIGDHELRVPSTMVLPTDERSLPAGPLTAVQDTTFDLRHGALLLEVLDAHRSGLDHSFEVVPDDEPEAPTEGVHVAAELHHPVSGRTLTVATDQPALHVYTADRLGPPFARRAAVCLEAQRFPDAPNRPALGSAFLRPGEHYAATTELTFGVR